MKKNLEGVRLGDRVYNYLMDEWGVVSKALMDKIYPLIVKFNNGVTESYTEDGRRSCDKTPVLFFDKPQFEYPERKWIPQKGDKVVVSDFDLETKGVVRVFQCMSIDGQYGTYNCINLEPKNWKYCKPFEI